MGADITFSDGTYFRDSYNCWNLAWVTGRSYWNHKGSNIAFMCAISKTTDKQIREYVDACIKKGDVESASQMDSSAQELGGHLKEKRDALANMFKKNPKVKVKMWSV
jgi:hypothetical protein